MIATYAPGMLVELIVNGERVALGEIVGLDNDETEDHLRVKVSKSAHPALPVAELVLRRRGSLGGTGSWSRRGSRSRLSLEGIVVQAATTDALVPTRGTKAKKRKQATAPTPEPPEPPVCPYCGKPTVLRLSSAHIYNGRDFGPVWECSPCGAWVGCHKNSSRHAPLGAPANAETRELRKQAHALFDPLWQSAMRLRGLTKGKARAAAYAWLGERLGHSAGHCHISWMQADELRQVIQLLVEVQDKATARRRAALDGGQDGRSDSGTT